jgi:FkbM family methyltransferase
MQLVKIVPIIFKQWAMRKFPELLCTTKTYSQSGEDIIVNQALTLIYSKKTFRYLDIGANNAFRLSNTALFYKNGGSGVLVEPNPELANKLRFMRGKKDLILECGVHFSGESEADLFIMDWDVLSTFSSEEADRYIKTGRKLKNKIRVPLMGINEILAIAGPVDFMSIDVEGLDESILRGINWSTHRPTCVCAETITYETTAQPTKLHDLIEYMINQDYIIFADTYLNTIFVDKRIWDKRFVSPRSP